MILDSFDWSLELLVDPIRAAIMWRSGMNEIPHWLGRWSVPHAANCLEELLEYLAAILFFMAIATTFSIKALGCDSMAIERRG